MSKFNTVRKVPNQRKHLVKTVKNPKLPTRPNDCQLEKNQIASRKSKYLKKSQSNIRKIISEE